MVTNIIEAGGEQAVARLHRGEAGGGFGEQQRVGGNAGDRFDLLFAVGAAEHAAVDDEMRIGLRESLEGAHDAGRGQKRTAAGVAAGGDQIHVRGDVAGDDAAKRGLTGGERGKAGRVGVGGDVFTAASPGAERDQNGRGRCARARRAKRMAMPSVSSAGAVPKTAIWLPSTPAACRLWAKSSIALTGTPINSAGAASGGDRGGGDCGGGAGRGVATVGATGGGDAGGSVCAVFLCITARSRAVSELL